MEALGRALNVIPLASGLHVSLKNASGVTFILWESGGAQDTDFKESKAGSGAQNLTFLNHYYAGDGVGSVWTRETADAGGTLDDDYNFVKLDTTATECAVIYVGADMLSPTFDCVEATANAGVCIAIVHDLLQQRRPDNLPASV